MYVLIVVVVVDFLLVWVRVKISSMRFVVVIIFLIRCLLVVWLFDESVGVVLNIIFVKNVLVILLRICVSMYGVRLCSGSFVWVWCLSS